MTSVIIPVALIVSCLSFCHTVFLYAYLSLGVAINGAMSFSWQGKQLISPYPWMQFCLLVAWSWINSYTQKIMKATFLVATRAGHWAQSTLVNMHVLSAQCPESLFAGCWALSTSAKCLIKCGLSETCLHSPDGAWGAVFHGENSLGQYPKQFEQSWFRLAETGDGGGVWVRHKVFA